METILKIEEVNEDGEWKGKSGYAITTNRQVVKLLIDNYQSCCEYWGYFMSEDNLENFVGAKMVDVYLTDTYLNTKRLEDMGLYEPNLMFVNVSTERGLLQFVAYNEHNGYYGHGAYVYSQQLNHETNL